MDALLETLRWRPGEGYFLKERHLARMGASAVALGMPFDPLLSINVLKDTEPSFPQTACRVRLLLDPDGAMRVEAAPLDTLPLPNPMRLARASAPVDSRNPRLRHKWADRSFYNQARAACPAADDAVLFNERGEATETTIGNLVVAREGRLLTPPVDCGLLPGVFRAELIARGAVTEAVLPMEELPRAPALFIINAVREWMPARWVP